MGVFSSCRWAGGGGIVVAGLFVQVLGRRGVEADRIFLQVGRGQGRGRLAWARLLVLVLFALPLLLLPTSPIPSADLPEHLSEPHDGGVRPGAQRGHVLQ